MSRDECFDFIEAILECWPDCEFAQSMHGVLDCHGGLTTKQQDALHNIWNRMDDAKLEAGYEAGEWVS